MGRYRFAVGSRFKFYERICWITKLLPNGHFVVEYEDNGEQIVKSLLDLCDEYFKKKSIEFERRGPNTCIDPSTNFGTGYKSVALQAFIDSDTDENEITYRYILTRPLMRLPEGERTRPVIEDYLQTLQDIYFGDKKSEWRGVDLTKQAKVLAWKRRIPSRATIMRWLKALEVSGDEKRSLAPNYSQRGHPGQTRLHPAVESIIQQVLAECAGNQAKRTTKIVKRLIMARISKENQTLPPGSENLEFPSFGTIYNRIHEFGAELILRRKRTRLERKAAEMSEGGPQNKLTRILERVEIDCTKLDLLVVHPEDREVIGRPTLVVAIDAYSRFPLGFYLGFEPPSYYAVMTCLYHAICPKPDVMTEFGTKHPWHAWGKPEVLITDNGKEFINISLVNSCEQLGIILEQMPVGHAWFKGIVERFLRSINSLIHTIPGTTHSSPTDRGDYDSIQNAVLTLEALISVLYKFLLDDYAQDWHEGINNTPAKMWTESEEVFDPDLEVDAETLRITLLASARRTVQRVGIEFESLVYYSPELADVRTYLRNQKKKDITFKYDPGDLGTIYIPDLTGAKGWIEVPALDLKYASGMTMYRHKVNRAKLLDEKEKVDIRGLTEAHEVIQQAIITEMTKSRKIRQTRRRSERLLQQKGNKASTVKDMSSIVQSDGIDKFKFSFYSDQDDLDLSGYAGQYNL